MPSGWRSYRLTGCCSRAILAALLAGLEAPEQLAELAKGRLREKRPQLEAALEGRVEAHHRFLLTQHLAHLDFLEAALRHADRSLPAGDGRTPKGRTPRDAPPPDASAQQALAQHAPAQHAPAQHAPAQDAPAQDAPPPDAGGAAPRRVRVEPEHPLPYAAAVQLLDLIPGVAERGAQAILLEIGTEMSRFPSAAQLCSWAGLAPGNHESAGKRRSGKTTEGNAVLRKALTQAAHGAKSTKGSYFTALYQRRAGRRGKRRAIVAVGHALLTVIYHMLRYQEPYRELGRDYYDERRKEGLVERLVKRLETLGYHATVELKAAAA